VLADKGLRPSVLNQSTRRSTLQGLVTLLLACLAGLRTPADAIMTMRLSLEQITANSDRAFVGRVVGVHSGRDSAGVPSTWVTFAVTQPLAGRVGSEVTIKQFGATEALADGTAVHFPGVPTYRPGDELVLFLSGESDAGFCAPIGLGQGTFPIAHRNGRTVVTATTENVGALGQARAAQPRGARMPSETDLDDFLGVVRSLIAKRPSR